MTENLRTKTKALLETAELKRIYTSIEACATKSGNTVLAITSASTGEGKTTILAGLAALAARNYNKRVLAIDMNWYAPGLHKFFGLDLLDLEKFKNGNSLNSLIRQTEINNLHVLPAARAQGENAGLNELDNKTLKTLIDKAREQYNIVLIDTSKVFPLNRRMIDPIEVAKNADGAVLVVLTNGPPRQPVKKARYALETAGVKILGVIVNQWKNPLA